MKAGGETAYQKSGAVDAGLMGRVDAGPMRLRRNGRQARAAGLYFSVKSGRHLPYESKLELHDLWRAEVDTRVVHSSVQPFTLQYVRDGVLTRYTPDRLDVLSDGSRRVVEVKTSVDRPEEHERFEAIASLLAGRGFAFELHQGSLIGRQPRLDAVEAVQRHRRTRLQAQDLIRLRRALEGGSSSLQRVVGHLGGGPTALAMVCAAVVRRVLWVDLESGLDLTTPVGLVA